MATAVIIEGMLLVSQRRHKRRKSIDDNIYNRRHVLHDDHCPIIVQELWCICLSCTSSWELLKNHTLRRPFCNGFGPAQNLIIGKDVFIVRKIAAPGPKIEWTLVTYGRFFHSLWHDLQMIFPIHLLERKMLYLNRNLPKLWLEWDKPALIQKVLRRQLGDNLNIWWSSLFTHVCVTRPRRVNDLSIRYTYKGGRHVLLNWGMCVDFFKIQAKQSPQTT